MLGLAIAATIRRIAASRLALVARTVLFLPQVIPLVAAGIAWSWLLLSTGVVNQLLSLVGLGGVTRAWLGDFATALPAVGVIGAWVLLGLCTLLLLAGMSKIDPALYEAARLDGAGPWREFVSITVPSLRQEIGVCVTVTVIAALASFDIIYISTQGGPGNTTMVPGLQIYYLAFAEREVGHRLGAGRGAHGPRARLRPAHPVAREGRQPMIAARREAWTGRLLLVLLMAVTLLPFLSLFVDRAAPVGHLPARAGLARRPAVGQLRCDAFEAAHMGELLKSSVLIVLGVVPVSLLLAHDGRLRHRPPAR